MSAAAVFATAALVSAATFTAWALYITPVEHPARVASGAAGLLAVLYSLRTR